MKPPLDGETRISVKFTPLEGNVPLDGRKDNYDH